MTGHITSITESFDNGKIQTGILQPLLQHRWKLDIPKLNTKELDSILSRQSNKCLISFKYNEIKLSIEQSTVGTEYEQIQNLIEVSKYIGFTLNVKAMDGSLDGSLHALQFLNCTIKEHEFLLDYSKNNPVTHEILIKYTKFLTLFPSVQSKKD